MIKRTCCITIAVCALAAVALAQGTPNPQGATPAPQGAAPAAPRPLPPITNTDYDISSTWFQLPAGMELGQPISVAPDGKGNIFFVRRRAQPPILVFDRQGKLLRSWGEGLFTAIHSIDVDRNGFVWATDNTDNVVYKFSADGTLLMTLGKRGVAGDNASQDLFDGPSDVFVAPNGDIFVTDGYRNSRVVRFDKDGKFLRIIGGTKGTGPAQFDRVHALVMDSKGRLIINDHNNGRIQVWDQDGTFIEQWANFGIGQPSGLYIEADDTVWVCDNQSDNIVKIKDGKVIETIKGLGGRPHLIALDQGVLYQADAPSGTFKRIRKK